MNTQNDPFKYQSKGLNFNFDKLDNFFRTISLNSPALKAAILGTAAYFGGKAATPFISRLLSPKIPGMDIAGNQGYDDLYPEEQEDLKKNVGTIAAIIAAAPTLIHNFDTNSPGLGWIRFPYKASYKGPFHEKLSSGLSKKANLFNPVYSMQTIPLSMAKNTIINHNTLTPMTKATSLAILNTFPENSTVTGKNIIDRAVSSGIDFAIGAAGGAITAHALGLPNPYTTALITGTINTLT